MIKNKRFVHWKANFSNRLKNHLLVQLALSSKKLIVLMGIMAILPLLVSSQVVLFLFKNRWLFEYPAEKQMALFSFGASILIGFALTPSTVVAILCGHFLGWMGLIPILISYPIAAVIGLLFGKILLNFAQILPFHKMATFSKFAHGMAKREFLFVAYSRLSPILPFAMMNLFLATFPVTWTKYVAGSMAGMLPRTLIFFWAGRNASEIWVFVQNPSLDGIWNLLPFLLIFISLAGLAGILSKMVQDATDDSKKQMRIKD